MRLTVVGCAGSYPNAESPASCYLVEHEGYRLVLDLGNGALGALSRYADLRSIDAVLLSHLHLDHCADVGSYYVARKYHPDGPLPPLPVVGPAGVSDRIVTMYADSTGRTMNDVFAFEDHTIEPRRIGPFTVTVAPVRHPVPAFATRVEAGGRSLVFSGDTGPTDALVDLAGGADIALFEASFLTPEVAHVADEAAEIHMTAAQAAEMAQRAGVRSLVLTHLVAWNDRAATEAEARPHFDGELQLARSGLTVDL